MTTDDADPVAAVDPVEMVGRFYESLAAGDLDGVLECLHDDVVIAQDPALPWGGRYEGHDGLAEFGLALSGAIESSVEREAVFRAGDRVVQYGRTRGMVRSSGVEFDIPECHVWTIRGDRLAAGEFYIDTPAMLEALGD